MAADDRPQRSEGPSALGLDPQGHAVGLVSSRQLAPSAEDVVLRELERQEVWQQVLRLSEPLREVLLLHAHHGLPLAAIAELLGITEGTVKSRLHRARAKVGKLRKEDEAR